MSKTEKPTILVIWGDDIGISNLSCYSHGLMGYRTPNIDRLAREGMMFWAATFKEFPPVQHPNSFTIDEALKMVTEAAGSAGH